MSQLTCGHIQHMYPWWWVRLSPETCGVKPLRRIKRNCCILLDLFHNYKAWCTVPQILNSRSQFNNCWILLFIESRSRVLRIIWTRLIVDCHTILKVLWRLQIIWQAPKINLWRVCSFSIGDECTWALSVLKKLSVFGHTLLKMNFFLALVWGTHS